MTGLIYVVIIGLWAAVLIPIWLKRHDQISEVRSTARFSSAMRSLGAQGKKATVQSRQGKNSSSSSATPSSFDTEDIDMRTHEARTHEARNYEARTHEFNRQKAHAQAAKRRTIVLAVLSGILLLTLIGAVLAIVPIWVAVVAAVLLGAFLVASALTASSRSQAGQQSRQQSPRKSVYADSNRYEDHEDSRKDARTSVHPTGASTLSRAERQRAELDEFAEWDPWQDENDSWDAVPSTLPTYVDSPRATAIRREIEKDGDWSGASMVEAARKMQRPAMRSEDLVRDPIVGSHDATAEIPIIRANAPYQARAVNE